MVYVNLLDGVIIIVYHLHFFFNGCSVSPQASYVPGLFHAIQL